MYKNIKDKNEPRRTKNDQNSSVSSRDSNYFSVSLFVLQPEIVHDFRVYLKQGDRYVLYTKEKETFSESLKERLYNNGIETVYIPYTQQENYENYMFKNLGKILDNDQIPNNVRSQILLDISSQEINKIFQDISLLSNDKAINDLYKIVDSSLNFLSYDDSLRNIGKLVSHDYMTYSHCLHVFVYTTAMMQRCQYDHQMIIDTGVGSMLHDIGKSLIPLKILNKPGKLNAEEWALIKNHPVYGLRLCAGLNFSSLVLNCILFHHERYDGNGYPSGIYGENIPYPVRILTCCDVYDALTSDRPYAKAEKPYQALAIMNEDMKGCFDSEVLKDFILMLGNM